MIIITYVVDNLDKNKKLWEYANIDKSNCYYVTYLQEILTVDEYEKLKLDEDDILKMFAFIQIDYCEELNNLSERWKYSIIINPRHFQVEHKYYPTITIYDDYME